MEPNFLWCALISKFYLCRICLLNSIILSWCFSSGTKALTKCCIGWTVGCYSGYASEQFRFGNSSLASPGCLILFSLCLPFKHMMCFSTTLYEILHWTVYGTLMLCSSTFLWHIQTDVDHRLLNAQRLDFWCSCMNGLQISKFYLMVEVGFFY